MLIEDLIIESYKNILPSDNEQRQRYANDVWDILQMSYAPIGGIKGNGFNNIKDMIDNIPFWKLCVRNNEVTAVLLYKDKKGRKRVAMATDGSSIGKKDLANMIKDEYKTNRAYAEISGGSLKFHKKVLGDEFQNILLPSEVALDVYDADEIDIIDSYTYKRNINGQWIEKQLVGTMDAQFPKS